MAVIIVGTNSWVTIAEADDYLENKIGASDWAGLTDANKTTYLISAFRYIRQKYNIPVASVLQVVKEAQIETAWWMYTFWLDYEKRRNLYSAGVTQFKISKFEEWLQKATTPQFLDDLIGEFKDTGMRFPLIEREYDE